MSVGEQAQDFSCQQVLLWSQQLINQQRPHSYDKTNTLNDAYSPSSSLQCRGIDTIKTRQKSYARFSAQCECEAMIIAFDLTKSCMSSSTTQMLCGVLIFSGCFGSAMSFEWRRMFRRDGYLMWRFEEVGKEDDPFCVRKTKSSKQLTQTHRKQKRLEGCVKAGRNPLMGLLVVN